MNTSSIICTVGCHAEGEIGEVIISGVETPPGETIWEKARYLESNGRLRAFLLHEPRGGVQKHMNLLVPPINPNADIGWIVMEPEDTPPMSGSNAICVVTVLLETGVLQMTEPLTEITLEAPGGLVRVQAYCEKGKVFKVEITNLPSFLFRENVNIEVPGVGTIKCDIAFGGDSFVIVDGRLINFSLSLDEAKDIASVGAEIVKAANAQIGFRHPLMRDWTHISFCQFTLPVYTDDEGILAGKNAVTIRPGKVDRSPTGTGCSARMALLHAQSKLSVGQPFRGISILNTKFDCRIKKTLKIGTLNAVIPIIGGQAWITGNHSYSLDPTDPFPLGYKISDTWPVY